MYDKITAILVISRGMIGGKRRSDRAILFPFLEATNRGREKTARFANQRA